MDDDDDTSDGRSDADLKGTSGIVVDSFAGMTTVAPACVGGASLDPDGEQTGGSEPTPAFVCPVASRRVSLRTTTDPLL